MNHSKTRILFSLFVLTVAPAMIAAPAMAGILAGDSTNSYLTIWHGSTPYQGYEADNVTPSGLTGYVDWAVYAPGSAPPGGFDGYAFPGGEYIYAYQVFETGSAALSSLSVDLDTNIVDSQGDFDTGGIDYRRCAEFSGFVPGRLAAVCRLLVFRRCSPRRFDRWPGVCQSLRADLHRGQHD